MTRTDPIYTLYWERLSGAIGPQVLLEEIGAAYRKVPVDMAAGEHLASAYRMINPLMRVPALGLPDGAVIGETAAITLVLGERHPDAGLVPAPGDPDRPLFLFWLVAMATCGYPVFSRACHPEQFTLNDAANETVRLKGESDLEEFFSIIEQAIGGKPHFLPRGFTALDIYLTMLSEWVADKQDLFGSRPKLKSLCQAVADRPAYRRVMEDHAVAECA